MSAFPAFNKDTDKDFIIGDSFFQISWEICKRSWYTVIASRPMLFVRTFIDSEDDLILCRVGWKIRSYFYTYTNVFVILRLTYDGFIDFEYIWTVLTIEIIQI